MFREIISPILRSNRLCLQLAVSCTGDAACWWQGSDGTVCIIVSMMQGQTSNLSRWDSMWADPDDLRTSAIKWQLEVCRKVTAQKRVNPVDATSKTINIHYSQLIQNSVLNMTYKLAGTLDACAISSRKFQLRSRHEQTGHCIRGQWPAFLKTSHRRSASVGSTPKSN